MATTWHVCVDHHPLEKTMTVSEVKEFLSENNGADIKVWTEGMEAWALPDNLDAFRDPGPGLPRVGSTAAREIWKLLEADDWSSYFRTGNVLGKHIAISVFFAWIFQWFLAGSTMITWFLNPIAHPYMWLVTMSGGFIISYFLSGRAFTGRWPFEETFYFLVKVILGPERSLRRRIIYSATITFTYGGWLFFVPGPYKILPLLAVCVIPWFLMGFYTRWDETPHYFSLLIPKPDCGSFTLRKRIHDILKEEDIPGLVVEEVRVFEGEKGTSAFATGLQFDADRVLQLTIGKARLVVKVEDQGRFTFVALQGFVATSGRRLKLIVMLLQSLVDTVVFRLSGLAVRSLGHSLGKILFDWSGRQTSKLTTGGATHDGTGITAFVPHFVRDHVALLEETTRFVLRDVVVDACRDEDREVPNHPLFEAFGRHEAGVVARA